MLFTIVPPAHAEDFRVDGVEIYVPDDLEPGDELRGSLEFRPFEGAKRWVNSPYMRNFANRAKFMMAAGFPSRENVARDPKMVVALAAREGMS